MTIPQIFINGKQVSSDKVFKSSFAEDEMFVFESLRSYGGVIFRLEEHLDRLFDSARTIGLELPKTRSEIKKELVSSLSSDPQQGAFLRLGIDRQNSYIVISERKRPGWIYEKGIDLKTVVTRRNFAKAEPTEPKTSAFFNNVLAIIEKSISPHPNPLPQGEGRVREDKMFFDAIFLDSNGYVTEGTIWNIFMAKESKLFTPGCEILNGVTRQFVIECAEKENLATLEVNLTRHDFWNADEAFLTNTSGEIVPIHSLDGRRIGNQIPGRMTKKLMVRFRQELEKELKP